ncbi:MAG TPA: polysaccharide biosynthesis/export family protein [Verrucomicrobiota bacterium]|nr:polysaccharide biosynthesis/export family protein [Verrucomicrobiota bacterium]HNU51932.1 polysaccharide biosynthesis/export family protein [Verrucomicrobiota bacterium]
MNVREWVGGWGLRLAGAGLLALVLAGCYTPSEPGGQAPAAQPAPVVAAPAGSSLIGIDNIRVGDKLEVLFTDIPDSPPGMLAVVREDGTITLPFGVTVLAKGKKAGDLQEEIRKEYVPKYYVRLTVTVKPQERVFYVGGCVRRPDRYVFVGEITLLGAIRVAGDFTEFAKRTEVTVTRADGTTLTIDCKKAIKNPRYDIPIYPGDSVHVPQRIWW